MKYLNHFSASGWGNFLYQHEKVDVDVDQSETFSESTVEQGNQEKKNSVKKTADNMETNIQKSEKIKNGENWFEESVDKVLDEADKKMEKAKTMEQYRERIEKRYDIMVDLWTTFIDMYRGAAMYKSLQEGAIWEHDAQYEKLEKDYHNFRVAHMEYVSKKGDGRTLADVKHFEESLQKTPVEVKLMLLRMAQNKIERNEKIRKDEDILGDGKVPDRIKKPVTEDTKAMRDIIQFLDMSPRELWEAKEGISWEKAKEEGLTDGSEEQNLQLKGKLMSYSALLHLPEETKKVSEPTEIPPVRGKDPIDKVGE